VATLTVAEQILLALIHKYRPEAIVMLGDYNLEVPLENFLPAMLGMTPLYRILGNSDFGSTRETKN